MLYMSPAGTMLVQMIHALLLLSVHRVRPLLNDLLSLLPKLDELNRLLPAASMVEEQELEWPLYGKI